MPLPAASRFLALPPTLLRPLIRRTSMKVRLIISHPHAEPQEFLVERFPLVIGRSSLADIAIQDRWASRLHCELAMIEGRLVVRDLASTYGTLVNGQPVAIREITPGDRLNVGLSTIVPNWEGASSIVRQAAGIGSAAS